MSLKNCPFNVKEAQETWNANHNVYLQRFKVRIHFIKSADMPVGRRAVDTYCTFRELLHLTEHWLDYDVDFLLIKMIVGNPEYIGRLVHWEPDFGFVNVANFDHRKNF